MSPSGLLWDYKFFLPIGKMRVVFEGPGGINNASHDLLLEKIKCELVDNMCSFNFILCPLN